MNLFTYLPIHLFTSKKVAFTLAEVLITDDNIGKCSFAFIFYPNQTYKNSWKYHYNKGIEPFLHKWDGQEDSLYNDSDFGCVTNGGYCTAIIARNGWKIPKDYPKRIKF